MIPDQTAPWMFLLVYIFSWVPQVILWYLISAIPSHNHLFLFYSFSCLITFSTLFSICLVVEAYLVSLSRAHHQKATEQPIKTLVRQYLFPVKHHSTAVDRVPVLQVLISRCHHPAMSHQPVEQVNIKKKVKSFFQLMQKIE